MFEKFPASQRAIDAAMAPNKSEGRVSYPIDDLDVNEGFAIPIDKANLPSLRSLASRKSKDGKKFVVVIHEDTRNVEFSRVA